MAFNSSISSNQLYAVLTPEGKRALALGAFNIKYAAFMDSIIDYSLANSANGDADILAMPIPEPSAEMANLANASYLITADMSSFDTDAILTIAGGIPNVGSTANPIVMEWSYKEGAIETSNIIFDNGTSNIAPDISITVASDIKPIKINNSTFKFMLGSQPEPRVSNTMVSGRAFDVATGAALTLYFKILISS